MEEEEDEEEIEVKAEEEAVEEKAVWWCPDTVHYSFWCSLVRSLLATVG